MFMFLRGGGPVRLGKEGKREEKGSGGDQQRAGGGKKVTWCPEEEKNVENRREKEGKELRRRHYRVLQRDRPRSPHKKRKNRGRGQKVKRPKGRSRVRTNWQPAREGKRAGQTVKRKRENRLRPGPLASAWEPAQDMQKKKKQHVRLFVSEEAKHFFPVKDF